MSHAAGVGNNLDEEITRATLLLKINNLAKGYAGIKLETLKTLVEMYNKGIYPLMPEKGSVGASGDLAPSCTHGAGFGGAGTGNLQGQHHEWKSCHGRGGY